DSSDFTDINIGAKVNLWGNDGGCTAFSVSPYVTIPNSSAPVTGGAALSFAVRLPAQFYLKFGVDPYAFANRNNDAKFGIEDSVSLHKMFGEKLDAYAYLDTDWRDGASDWSGMSGFGAGYLVTPGFELFASMGFGLTSNSYDYNPRFGIAFRF
ncbi:MAG TPA: transporter, partial [Verrucomicrobiae bacterium]